ncbi:hypothetical protein FBU30_003179 [Linnemannia zychae]|nr:hypothetical protein FBU30_003179 [Linnemannia zychae]
MSARILQDEDWVVSVPAKPATSSVSSRTTRAPQRPSGNINTGNYISTLSGVTRSYTINRDQRQGTFGFFSSGQNTHQFESYLTRKGHQDVRSSVHQVKSNAPERVSVPLPEGTGKAEGVWNAFNGTYTQQDWANYARGQVAPSFKKSTNTTARLSNPLPPSRPVQKPSPHSSSTSTMPPPAAALSSTLAPPSTPAPTSAPVSIPAPAPLSRLTTSPSPAPPTSATSPIPKPVVAPSPPPPPPRPPTPLIDLEFSSTPTVTPILNSSVLADLLDLDFSDCASPTISTTHIMDSTTAATSATITSTLAADITGNADVVVKTDKANDSIEKPVAAMEECTLIDFSGAFTIPVIERTTHDSAMNITSEETNHLDEHTAGGEYTTDNSDYDDDSDNDSDSNSDNSDDNDYYRQSGVEKNHYDGMNSESEAKGDFVDFVTLSNLRTELLEANVTWDQLLSVKGVRT